MSCVLFNLQGAYRFAVVFATAYLIYHTFIGLSRTFLKFFNFLFSSSVPTATAHISYHITSALSIPFSKLFSSFFQYFTQLHLRLFYILSHNILFVKNFFILFLISHLFCDSFDIISYNIQFVNSFLKSFFNRVWRKRNHHIHALRPLPLRLTFIQHLPSQGEA